MTNHYRYRKVTPEILKRMQELREEEGKTYKEIADIIGTIGWPTVMYWLNENVHKKRNERSLEYSRNLSKEEKKEKQKKEQPYRSQYYKERYHNDPEFRRKVIDSIIRYQKRVRRRRKNEKIQSN